MSERSKDLRDVYGDTPDGEIATFRNRHHLSFFLGRLLNSPETSARFLEELLSWLQLQTVDPQSVLLRMFTRGPHSFVADVLLR